MATDLSCSGTTLPLDPGATMPPGRLSGALAAILAACPDADRSASIAAITGGHATHKLCQPAAKLPESGMAGFAAGLAPEPVSTLAGFEVTRRKCRQTVSRWMPSSCAIRRWTSQGGNRASPERSVVISG